MAMRVGMLHYTAPPVIGGVETVLGQHARLLAEGGHRARILTGRGGRPSTGIQVVRIPLADARHPAILTARAALDRGHVPVTFDRLVGDLTAALRPAVADVDVLVAHNVCSLHFNLPLTAALYGLVAEPGGPAFVAWQHDLAWTAARYAGELHPGWPWDLLRTAWPRTTYVAVSEARRDEQSALTGMPISEVQVVPNGIDVGEILGLRPATVRILHDLNLSGRGPILLAPVRITPRKNLELAIGVVAELRRAGGDPRLIVTGPPDPHARDGHAYVARLRELATAAGADGAVHLLDVERGRRTPSHVVSDLYRVADALLLPSTDEGFGLPLIEAAASRLPVICADLPTLRELAGGDATYFHPDAGPAAVARLVQERLAGEAASRFSDRARAEYGWPTIFANRIEPLLAAAAARG